jgi:hypothetical protein
MLSGLEILNQPLNKRFRGFLKRVIEEDTLHGRFLNTLSLLEHIGSRKIMLAHLHKSPNGDVLKHMAEEARHAYFFSHRAELLLKKPLHDYSQATTLAPAAAKMYFGKLDSMVEHTIAASGAADACYLWVSLMIELRAHWAYGLYQEALQQHQKAFSLKSLIAEENLHLAEMFESVMALDYDAEKRIPELAQREHELFLNLFTQLETAI